MSPFLALALILSSNEPLLPILEHSVRVEHAGDVVDARYRTRITVSQRQVGAVTKTGTPSPQRCAWSANVRIERAARSANGVHLARAIERQGVLQGSRAGWCATSRHVAAREVAGRVEEIRAGMMTLAEEDAAVLKAELDEARTKPIG